MEVYQIHFEAGEERKLKTFFFQPENVYKSRLGRLFLAGDTKKDLDSDNMLGLVSRIIKEEFYTHRGKDPALALKETLKVANKYFQQVAAKGSVDWISDFNFAILNLVENKDKKGFTLNFTSTGSMKVVLLRGGDVINLGQKLEKKEIDPFPVKVFFNIVSGQIQKEDRLFVLSENVYKNLLENNFLKKIAQAPFLSDRRIKRSLSPLKKNLSGVCLIIDLVGDEGRQKKNRMMFKTGKKKKVLQEMKSRFSPSFLKSAKANRVTGFFSDLLSSAKDIFRKFFKKAKKKFQKVNFPSFSLPVSFPKKEIAWILLLLLIVLLARSFSGKEGRRDREEIRGRLEVVQEKQESALLFLQEEKQEDARNLLKEAWEDLKTIPIKGDYLKEEIENTKKEIENELLVLYGYEKIEEPSVFYEFPEQEFLPQKIVMRKGDIFGLSFYSNLVFKINEEGDVKRYETSFNFKGGDSSEDGVVVFQTTKDEFIKFEDEVLTSPFQLEKPYEGFKFKEISYFSSNLYFWGERRNEIVKYLAIGSADTWSRPSFWLKEEIVPGTKVNSMSIDGGIWLLGEKEIYYFYKGELEKSFTIDIFPSNSNYEKIITPLDSQYLFLLDSGEERIVVLNKENGKTVKQIVSPRFKNLKDFGLYQNDLFILDGSILYKISLDLPN